MTLKKESLPSTGKNSSLFFTIFSK
ncbi:hypothetical protein [Desulfosporosinus sp. BICA1-9]